MLNNINSSSGLNPCIYSSSEEIASEESQGNISQTHVPDDPIIQPQISEKIINELVSQYVLNETLLSQKIFENFERLTLSEAEILMLELIKNKTIKFLSSLDILLVDIMKIMQQLSKDRTVNSFSKPVALVINEKIIIEKVEGKEILHCLSVELYSLLRSLHNYCPLLQGKLDFKVYQSQLLEGQKNYLKVVNFYSRLESIAKDSGTHETKSLCWKLKKYCDVLYHLSHDSNFLKKI
ncbi:MAG: hypothetical protein H0W50_10220 [Parachlamydiaceae bacterium]|nr:hypothetical protein [Parachlamydiaceae bacterium]